MKNVIWGRWKGGSREENENIPKRCELPRKEKLDLFLRLKEHQFVFGDLGQHALSSYSVL